MSYTAPQLSSVEEANELAQASELERIQIYRDKYGREPAYNDEGSVREGVENSLEDDGMLVDDIQNNHVAIGEEENDNNAQPQESHVAQQDEENSEQNGGNINHDESDNNYDEVQEEEEQEDHEDSDIGDDLVGRFFEELDNIPLGEKLEYVEALVQVPEIVEDESNPLNFIRHNNYDPAAAALSFCQYWERRVEIFGDEDAFKPMTLQGACHSITRTVADLPNYFRLLPNDDYGRKVFCADRTNVDYTGKDQMDIVKYFWLIYHDALRDGWTQRNGIVGILICRGMNYSYLNRKAIKYMFSHRLPMKPCCVHFCFSSLSARIILPVMKYFMTREDRQRTELHLSVKIPTVLKELEEFGLQAKKLPPNVGGTYNEVPSWVSECRQIVKNERKQRRKQQRQEQYSNDRWYMFRS